MFKTFRYVKNKLEANRATQGNTFISFFGCEKIPLGDRVGWNPPAPTVGFTALSSYYRLSLFLLVYVYLLFFIFTKEL